MASFFPCMSKQGIMLSIFHPSSNNLQAAVALADFSLGSPIEPMTSTRSFLGGRSQSPRHRANHHSHSSVPSLSPSLSMSLTQSFSFRVWLARSPFRLLLPCPREAKGATLVLVLSAYSKASSQPRSCHIM